MKESCFLFFVLIVTQCYSWPDYILQKECEENVIFILDASSSISNQDWNQILVLTAEIIKHLPKDTKVSVEMFAYESETTIPITADLEGAAKLLKGSFAGVITNRFKTTNFLV